MKPMKLTVDASAIDWDKGEGLVPAVVQDAATLRVLMLGYMNRDALQATLDTQRVTFFSRSKGRLWQKGETSGNVLRLVGISVDCDGDTLLIMAEPAGPVCHLGTATCFGDASPDVHVLEDLCRIVEQRKSAAPETSYTARLLARGVTKIAQKVGEEGVETALAAVAENDDRLVGESADLLYHLVVLWAAKGLPPEAVWAELRRRFPPSHHNE